MQSPARGIKFCSTRAQVACGAWAQIRTTKTFLSLCLVFTLHLGEKYTYEGHSINKVNFLV